MERINCLEHVSKSNDDDNDVERISIDKEVLVNIDCPVGLILDYVREVARLDKTCKIDLCDELNCQLKNLSIAEPSTSGLHLLQPDIIYFVVIFSNNTNDQSTTLIPLVSTKIGKKCMEIFKKNRQKKNAQK
ncbi:hypothetical protein V1477_000385 [Vespula maculifrons]|uniref:Uncharacterized protein n=1 Tax=Vespula maculifrons TaxID=7453 RepID=A0ABD2D1G2_VESMC